MLVRPKLEYGAIAWNPHTKNNIDTLEKIHRSAARFVVHDHRRTTSVTHIQSKLDWQTLETRPLQHQLVFLYKIKYNLLNISLPQHLIVPCTRTRNSDPNKFVQIPTRINTYAYSFYRINNDTLFKKLVNRNVPAYIVRLLVFWYSHQQMFVKWGNVMSSVFTVSNGVRQGGVLSPYLFNVYMDGLNIIPLF